MRIAINALAHVAGGGITYLKNLLPKLAELGNENEYFVLTRKSLSTLDLNLPDNFKIINPQLPSENLFIRFFWEQVILPFKLHSWNIDLLFSPTDTTTLLAPCPVVLAIRNPNPYTHHEFENTVLESARFRLLKVLSGLSSKKASKVIFVSNWSKNVVCKQLKIPPSKSLTIYHGFDYDVFYSGKGQSINKNFRKKISSIGKYILSVSTIYPHKNYLTLIHAYNELDNRLKNEYALVIAGGKQSESHCKKLTDTVESLDLKERIIFLGKVKYEYVPFLYHGASLYVLPSFLETFGHTLVESMASRVPIIAANSTAIPEILGDAGILFDPLNPNELAAKMTKVLKDKKLQNELIQKGKERVKNFSWEKAAKRTLQVFEHVVMKGRRE